MFSSAACITLINSQVHIFFLSFFFAATYAVDDDKMSRGLFVVTQHLPFDRWPFSSRLHTTTRGSLRRRRRRSLSILFWVHRVPLERYIDDDETHHHSALKFDQVRIHQSFALTRTSSSRLNLTVLLHTRYILNDYNKTLLSFFVSSFLFLSSLNTTCTTLLPQ